jgi:signal transduction histidine kinase
VNEPNTLSALATRYGVGETLTGAILIVDDDTENLAVLQAFLDNEYVVHATTSGKEALDIAVTTGIDVVIADQRMPEMTGTELLEEIRGLKPDVAGILLTAYTDAPVLVSAINRARVFRHMKKPWDPDDLLAAVSQASEHVHQCRLNLRLVHLLARRSEELSAALDELRMAQQHMQHMERLSTMGRLAAGVTHDLRNVLTGLMMLERLATTQQVPAMVLEPLRVNVAAMRNLLGSLTTLNQFASRGALDVQSVMLDPADVVRDAETVARMDMNYRERKLVVSMGPKLPSVFGDRQKLVQVLVNLLTNALQATQPGQTIRVEARPGANDTIVFAVEDEGEGIPESLAHKVFEPFFSTKGDQGMGMGLYMARLIAESHGGSLRLVAPEQFKRGARFELVVPAAPRFH